MATFTPTLPAEQGQHVAWAVDGKNIERNDNGVLHMNRDGSSEEFARPETANNEVTNDVVLEAAAPAPTAGFDGPG